MHIESLSPNFYPYNFRDFIVGEAHKGQQASQENVRIPSSDLAANMSNKNIAPAPQDLGEIKSHFQKLILSSDKQKQNVSVNSLNDKDDTWTSDNVTRYYVYSGGQRPQPVVRQKMEALVRKNKQLGLQCPYKDEKGYCTAHFIRCGERNQFSVPEARYQYRLPHLCLYKPKSRGMYILIVESNKTLRNFCKSAIELFFNYDPGKIFTVENGKKGLDQLNRFKVEGKNCGLIICDTALTTEYSGIDLIETVYRRNYQAGIVLTRETDQPVYAPKRDVTINDIPAYNSYIKKIITKPFHSEVFINTLRSLGISNSLK